jgi:hypothetical protein
VKERITEDTEEEREHGEGMRRPGAEASTRIGPKLSGLKFGPISEAKAKYTEIPDFVQNDGWGRQIRGFFAALRWDEE